MLNNLESNAMDSIFTPYIFKKNKDYRRNTITGNTLISWHCGPQLRTEQIIENNISSKNPSWPEENQLAFSSVVDKLNSGLRSKFSWKSGPSFSKGGYPSQKSLSIPYKKWNCVLSKFMAVISTGTIGQMSRSFPGVIFFRQYHNTSHSKLWSCSDGEEMYKMAWWRSRCFRRRGLCWQGA